MQNQPFYAEGLYFSCTRCSSCCRHEPGYVFLSKNDVALLSKEVNLDYAEFLNAYCRWIPEDGGMFRLSLREKPNYDCIFWDKGCVVYQSRPLQCRAFPFWPSNVASSEDWEDAARYCPGMKTGTLHSRERIEDWLRQQMAQFVNMIVKN